MPFHNGEKWACYSCTKGHRSSKCAHYDRILYKVRKPGRPLNNCPHVLPETIQPGTFVNTSAESMANGNPPNEPCNCKNELVEVAIPKVKNCSCLSSSSTTDVSAPVTNGDSQSVVKTGRVSKRHTKNRRSKSIVDPSASEMAATFLKSEGQITVTHPSCCDNGQVGQNLVSPVSNPLDPQPSNPNTASHTHLWQHSPQNPGNANMLPQQASLGFHPSVNPVAQPPSAVFHDQMMSGSYPHVNRSSEIPDILQPFPYGNIQKHLANQQSNEQTHGHTTGHAPTQQVTVNSVDSAWRPQIHRDVSACGVVHPADMLMVPLTPDEWLWVQHAREAGVNFADLPKFIAKTEPHSSLQSGPSRPPASPKPQDSAKKVGGCCGKPATSPASTTCTSTTQTPAHPVNSPRCKCGDACRCVPCADHPFNPAMMETIKGDMQLIQEHASNSSKGPEGPGRAVIEDSGSYEVELDENSPRTESISGDANDFRDFVFYNYSYGGGCAEGRGGCMCGDGCTCVGCLTHGGHDGVPLNLGAAGDPGG